MRGRALPVPLSRGPRLWIGEIRCVFRVPASRAAKRRSHRGGWAKRAKFFFLPSSSNARFIA